MEGKPVNKSTRILVALLVGLACGLAVRPAQAALSDPAQIQTEAYVNLVQADQSLDAGRLDEALAQYQAARDYYLQLARDFPGWEPRVIQYRKTYCDNQIADVERRKAGGQPEEVPELPPDEPVAEPQPPETAPVEVAEPAVPESAPAADRSVEIGYLKSRIASLEADLSELGNLQDKLDGALAESGKLRQDLDAANQQLAGQEDSNRSTLAGLRSDLAKKDEKILSLQQDADAKKQLDQALNDLEAQVGELRAQNERLNQEVKNLDAELDETEIRADQAELKATQAEAKLKDAENAIRDARDGQADADKKRVELDRKPAPEKLERAKPEEQAKAAESAPETAPAIPSKSPVMATVPPKPVPKGMLASDYVRQLLQEGDNESALATVQEARKAFPTDMNLVLIEGIALIRLQRYPEAATMLVDLAKNNPRNAEIHATLGAAMMGAGFYEEARDTLLMAVKLDKNVGGEYFYNLAQLYALVEPIDLKQARKYYKQARDLGIAADPQLEKAMK